MNISIPPIPSELFTAFNDVTFFDEPHKYYVNGQELISVTTLIGKYHEDFNEKYWSDYKATQHGVYPYEILRAWKHINKKGTIRGSAIHDYAENLFQNKKFEYPENLILKEFGFDPVRKTYEACKSHVDRFYNDVQGKLIPIRTELVMHDKDLLIGGMLDIVFWNVKMQEFQIWDWKTNKEFTLECPERHLINELCMLQESDIEIYSLQLEMYKQIIEKHVPIKLGQSYLVWFSHNNKNYEIIKTLDRRYHVNLILESRKMELAA